MSAFGTGGASLRDVAQLPFLRHVASARGEDPFPTLADATRTHISEALRRTGGQIEGARGAAALLDLNPHTLRGKMRKLAIDWASFRQDPDQTEGASGANGGTLR